MPSQQSRFYRSCQVLQSIANPFHPSRIPAPPQLLSSSASLPSHKLITLSVKKYMPMVDKDLIIVVAVAELLIVQCESANSDEREETGDYNASYAATGQGANLAGR